MNATAEFQRQEMHRHERKHVSKRRRGDDELAMAFTAVALQESQYNFRRFWVDAGSNHWISHLLDGVLLQEEQFAKTFRMNRNSFNALHSLLGMYPIQI